jgi:hypothetical protein
MTMPNAVHPGYHDVREERVGGFGGSVAPSAPFGKYAGPPRRRWQAAGGFAGAPDAQRQGSYADIEFHRHRRRPH